MPNWCYNRMEIMGSQDDLQQFVDATRFVESKDTNSYDNADNSNGGTLFVNAKAEHGVVHYGLNHLFPIPAELQATPSAWYGDADKQAEQTALEQANIAKYGYKDWYDWACDDKNWSTKWGACDFEWTSFDVDDNYIVGPTEPYISATYNSAWGPADGLIRNISAKFPNITFSVVSTEESDAFACFSIFRNGQLLAEGGEEPVRPKDLDDLYEKDPDAFYEALNDWQCETSDKWATEADKAYERLSAVNN